MSVYFYPEGSDEPVVDLRATFEARLHGLVHDFGVLDEERRGQLAALREELAALKEEVCELRSALDSERLGRASMEWKLDNLAEDFGDLVDGLKEAGVLALGRDEVASGPSQIGEARAGASSVVAQNFNKRKEAGNE